ncbi:MAG: nucleotidyltransferase family protein [Clostridia bacterium]
MKALILAAGYSTRLYPLTLHTPKALLPIGSGTMMDFLAHELHAIQALSEVLVVTNARFFDQFEAWAARARAQYAPLRFTVLNDGTRSDQEKLGAVGDIQFSIAQAGIDEDLLVAASDDFFTFPLTQFTDDFARHGRDLLLGTRIASVEDLRRFAVATLDLNGRVTSLIEKPQDPPSDIAIYAVYLYRKDTLALIKQYLDEGGAPDAPGHFPEWLYKRREVRVYQFTGECIDIGTPAAYEMVCARFKGEEHG